MVLNVERGKQGFQETVKSEPSSPDLGAQDVGVDEGDKFAYVDPYPGRKGSERIRVACGKCGGTGIYNAPTRFTDNHGKPLCFDCSGQGTRSVLISSLRQTAKRQIKAQQDAAERAAAFGERNDDAAAQLSEAIPGFALAFETDVDSDDYYSDASIAHQAAWEALIRLRDSGDLDDAVDSFDYSTRRRYLPKLISANKWAKPCVVCEKRVKAGEGVLAIRDAKGMGEVWETYCVEDIPTDAVDARKKT